MKEIISSQGDVILVDDQDYEWLSSYRWTVGRKPGRPLYARMTYTDAGGARRTAALHRMIMNPPKGYVVDHIDHNTLNNQRENLRICTLSENSRNARKRKGMQAPKGVAFIKRDQRYQAYINVKGRRIYLGNFADQREAAHAYNRAAVYYFGEFAALNPY